MVQPVKKQRSVRILFVAASAGLLGLALGSCGGGDSGKTADTLAAAATPVVPDSTTPNSPGTINGDSSDSARGQRVCDGAAAVARGDQDVFGPMWLVDDIADDSCSFILLDSATKRLEKNRDVVALAWLVAVGERSDGALAEAMTDYMSRAFLAMPVETSLLLEGLEDTHAEDLIYEGFRNALADHSNDRINRTSIEGLRKHVSDPQLSPKASAIVTHIIDEALKPAQ